MSDYEEDFSDIRNFSRTILIESMYGAHRAEPKDQWTASNVKSSSLLDGSTAWFKYEELIDDSLDLL